MEQQLDSSWALGGKPTFDPRSETPSWAAIPIREIEILHSDVICSKFQHECISVQTLIMSEVHYDTSFGRSVVEWLDFALSATFIRREPDELSWAWIRTVECERKMCFTQKLMGGAKQELSPIHTLSRRWEKTREWREWRELEKWRGNELRNSKRRERGRTFIGREFDWIVFSFPAIFWNESED